MSYTENYEKACKLTKYLKEKTSDEYIIYPALWNKTEFVVNINPNGNKLSPLTIEHILNKLTFVNEPVITSYNGGGISVKVII